MIMDRTLVLTMKKMTMRLWALFLVQKRNMPQAVIIIEVFLSTMIHSPQSPRSFARMGIFSCGKV